MKKVKTIVLSSLLFGLSVNSVLAETFYDYARVVKVQPVYHYVTVSQPVQQCYPVEHRVKVPSRHANNYHHNDRKGATIVGAVLGGAIGNVLGKATGSNRNVTTLAGAVIGGSIAHDSQHIRHDRHYKTQVRIEQHCEVVYQKSKKVREVKGYDVKYRYEGQAYKTFMRKHPGDTVKVRVRVSPAGYDY